MKSALPACPVPRQQARCLGLSSHSSATRPFPAGELCSLMALRSLCSPEPHPHPPRLTQQHPYSPWALTSSNIQTSQHFREPASQAHLRCQLPPRRPCCPGNPQGGEPGVTLTLAQSHGPPAHSCFTMRDTSHKAPVQLESTEQSAHQGGGPAFLFWLPFPLKMAWKCTQVGLAGSLRCTLLPPLTFLEEGYLSGVQH